jgi:hypothetical protein
VRVLGLGTGKSPEAWRAACTEFRSPDRPACKVPAAARGAAAPGPSEAIRAIIEVEGGSSLLSHLGGRLGLRGVALKSLGVPSWRSYLGARPDLYRPEVEGAATRVRWLD